MNLEFYDFYNIDHSIGQKQICKNINKQTLNELLDNPKEPNCLFVKNKKTNRVLIITSSKLYIISQKDFDSILKQKNIYYELLSDIIDLQSNVEAVLEGNWYAWNFRYGLPWSYEMENAFRESYSELDKKTALIKNRLLSFSSFALLSNISKIEISENNIDKINKNIQNLYSSDNATMPLYKEFFVDKNFSIKCVSQPSGNNHTYTKYVDSYSSDDINDYDLKNKDYGVIINLSKVSILKSASGNFDIKNKADVGFDYYHSSGSHRAYSMTTYDISTFIPKMKTKDKCKSEERLLSKLKEFNIKTYNRILKGKKELFEEYQNPQILLFNLSTSKKGSITVSDLKLSTLAPVDTYSDKNKISEVLDLLIESKSNDWIILNATTYSSAKWYLNKTILKEKKFKYSLKESKSSYYQNISLEIRLNKRSAQIILHNDKIFDELFNIGVISEEEKDTLKCEYILKTM